MRPDPDVQPAVLETPDDDGDGKLSRRRFIRIAGGSLAAGTAAVALGNAAAALTKPHTSPDSRAVKAKATRAGATPLPILESTTPDAAALPGEQAFSIFWITDTQFLSESNPALFRMTNNWIVENWAHFNGKMVVHTGDIVENGPSEEEWFNADEAMSILLAKKIPYTWCAGNHDNLVEGDATSGWKGSALAASLDPSTVSTQVNALPYARWAGDYHQGMNTAVSFSTNALNFLVINIEWNAQPDVLQWVEGLLDDPAYADHRVIVAPHAYVDATGSLDNQRWGAQLADFLAALTSLIDRHSSTIFLTLNGHFATECGYNTPQPINDRNQLMFDRQDCADSPADLTGRGVDEPPRNDTDKVGGATVTVLTFDTVNNRIRARTFDVYLGKWRTHSTEQYAVAMFPDVVPKLNAVTQ